MKILLIILLSLSFQWDNEKTFYFKVEHDYNTVKYYKKTVKHYSDNESLSKHIFVLQEDGWGFDNSKTLHIKTMGKHRVFSYFLLVDDYVVCKKVKRYKVITEKEYIQKL